MAELAEFAEKATENENNHELVKSATKLVDSDSKTALIVLGGVSIGVLLYKVYTSLPSPHPSIPTAPNMHPILGHIPFFQNNYDKLHDALYSVIKDHDIIAFILPGFNDIFMNSPELIEWVFTTQFDKFEKGNSQNDKFRDLFGDYGQGIFVSDGAHWRFHRKIGSRMFSVRNLRDYMFKCATTTTSKTMDVLEGLRSSGLEIDICDILGRMTFDCFTSIAFGISFDSLSLYPKKHPFGVSFDKLVNLNPRRLSDPLWKLKRFINIGYEREMNECFKIINEFSDNLITEKRKNAKQNITDETGKDTFDLFTLYEKHNPELTTEDMRYIAFNFIIAGRDTTRMLTSWFLYDLSIFPEVKKKIIQEIDEFDENDVNFTTITKQFKYLEASLCETLRYHPSVLFSLRVAKQDIVVPKHILRGDSNGNPYLIKKGDRMNLHHYTICKSTKFYRDPMKYDPMRFYEKGVNTFKQSIYPFFNQSPRLCLGREFALMEAKIFIYRFLKTYHFDVEKNQEITYTQGFILNMKNGLKIKIKKRN